MRASLFITCLGDTLSPAAAAPSCACATGSGHHHPTCHGMRMLRPDDKPLRLLRSVRGLDLVELPQAEGCCGFGGTFAVLAATDEVRG